MRAIPVDRAPAGETVQKLGALFLASLLAIMGGDEGSGNSPRLGIKTYPPLLPRQGEASLRPRYCPIAYHLEKHDLGREA